MSPILQELEVQAIRDYARLRYESLARLHWGKERATMPLTGQDVWEAIVKQGLMSGPYDPRSNSYCANAQKIAAQLNEVLRQRQDFLPNLVATEDAIRAWEANTPREYVLRLYKTLNLSGYTVAGIDAAIEREAKKRKPSEVDSTMRKARP